MSRPLSHASSRGVLTPHVGTVRSVHQPQHDTDARGADADARSGEPSVPREAHVARSAAFLAQFEQLRQHGDDVLRLQHAASRLFSTRPALEFDGFAALLDHLVPVEDDAQRRLARSIGLDVTAFQRLCASRVDPMDLSPEPLVTLARALSLEQDTFYLLLERDHQRHVAVTGGSTARGGRSAAQQRAALNDAWDRDAEDDPME